ncbi:CASP-like protein 1c1 [Phtheirospermum japonicum]|uniref:CASP-like protein n=1 Tax=Phtheirospermum japonicum TaxID=374723 RepID=A0A830CMP5_9LAMI|nr:CASP-like protein 1c1 [Phtheirospermum japonicum]
MSLSKRIPIFVLRLLALGATISATLIMVTSHDTAQVFNMKFEAKYSNSPTFKYFVLMNAIASDYCIAAGFKLIGMYSNRTSGEERQQLCRLAAHLWTSS